MTALARLADRWHTGWAQQLRVALEYLTFGRPARLLIRVWALQIIILMGDAAVIRSIHPYFMGVFNPADLLELYLAATMVCIATVVGFVFKMGELTYAPRFHRPRHLVVSAGGYLALSSTVVLLAMAARDLTPNVASAGPAVDVALAAMTSAFLAALLSMASFAQFRLTGPPERKRTKHVIGEWLDAIDWSGKPTGAQSKKRRYLAFEERTETVQSLLNRAVTTEGRRIHDDFQAWYEQFRSYSLLTRERIVDGDVRNPELQAQHDELRRLAEELDIMADRPDTTTDLPNREDR